MLRRQDLLLACLILLCQLKKTDAFSIDGNSKSLHQLEGLIKRCFRSICKDWMHECHWFCDPHRGQVFYWRCMECLSWRGRHCFECFDL